MVPAYVELPPGEDVPPHFLDWCRTGRVPEGAVLCEFVGKGGHWVAASGYAVAGLDPTAGESLRAALGGVGAAAPAGRLEGYRIAATVVRRRPAGTFVVFVPGGRP